jgi:hypothetical protein
VRPSSSMDPLGQEKEYSSTQPGRCSTITGRRS